MSENYEDLANRSWDEIPEEKLLPTGSWLLRGRNATIQAPKEEGKSPQALFVYEPKGPMDDVSDEELAALGGDYDTSMNRIFVRFWLETGKDYHAVRDHLKKHGVEGKNLAEAMKNFKGSEVIAIIGQRSFTDNMGQTKDENTATNFTPVE